jgi:hypothetical protein
LEEKNFVNDQLWTNSVKSLSEVSENENLVTVSEGLDFMLEHFYHNQQLPLFPRNVSTATTKGAQYIVDSKERAIVYFKAALRQDCRIAVYPNYEKLIEDGVLPTEYKPKPAHIFIDLDLNNFDGSIEALNTALKLTLRNIKTQLGGVVPTILWSGGGVHVHCPLDPESVPIYEEMEDFKQFRDVSSRFMRYSARRLTANNSDPNHSPSFKSCMARVPGSINTKYEGGDTITAEVRILQRWNGVRAKPTKQFLVTDFLVALVQKEMIDKNVTNIKFNISHKNRHSATTTTAWIERLLQTPIADYRKGARDLILVPYLVVRRGLGPNEVYSTVMKWAIECDKLKPLQPSRRAYADRVRTRIQEVMRNRVPPMSMQALYEMNPNLCELLTTAANK